MNIHPNSSIPNPFSKKITLFLVLLLLSSFFGIAQTLCKPIIRANQRKTVSLKFMGYNKITYPHITDPNLSIVQYYNIQDTGSNRYNKPDSIVIMNGNIAISKLQLPLPGLGIINYTNELGELLTDSLGSLKSYYHYSTFYHYYSWRGVVWTKNLTRNKITYYRSTTNSNDTYGESDSAILEFYPQGTLKRISLKEPEHQGDNKVQEFDANGILICSQDRNSRRKYKDGILQSDSTYSYLKNYGKVLCIKEYKLSGILKKEIYYKTFWNDSTKKDTTIPYLKWKYYDDSGMLVRTEQKSTKQYPGEIIEAVPPPDRTFFSVEQMAEFPGGIKNLEKYIQTQFSNFLCESKKELNGEYKMSLTIGTDGIARLLKFEGLNTEELSSIVTDMPKWRPARFNGRPGSVEAEIKISVQKN